MQQVEVEVVGAEPPEALLAGPQRALVAREVGANLAAQVDRGAATGDGLASACFGAGDDSGEDVGERREVR